MLQIITKYGIILNIETTNRKGTNMKIYNKEKRISKKEAERIFGKECVAKRIKESKEIFANDPNEEIAWADGMRIELETK